MVERFAVNEDVVGSNPTVRAISSLKPGVEKYMTMKLVWRLKERPTAKSLQELVATSILTKEEAREILFSSENVEDRDKASYESEIKFLRDTVELLSKKDNSRIIEVIREVEIIKPYYLENPWNKHYGAWCGTDADADKLYCGDSGTSPVTHLVAMATADNSNFSKIKTF